MLLNTMPDIKIAPAGADLEARAGQYELNATSLGAAFLVRQAAARRSEFPGYTALPDLSGMFATFKRDGFTEQVTISSDGRTIITVGDTDLEDYWVETTETTYVLHPNAPGKEVKRKWSRRGAIAMPVERELEPPTLGVLVALNEELALISAAARPIEPRRPAISKFLAGLGILRSRPSSAS